ncbi:MAG: hypothetical protein RI575_17435 [Balneolaceae bacterium]|nr:hypothetical protein [Balneolaceae bacterium]MDR9410207.1 hypothetical protein [Balneolaceae bacterium]
MRYFIGCAAILLFALAGCSSTETVQQETQPDEPIEEESLIPTWYDDGIHSSSDSLEFHGYALSSAMDSTKALDLSTQTALENLRFEIDRFAEEVRNKLTDTNGGEGQYSSPEFIIQLRNSVYDLSLESATITSKHELSDKGVHYSYARASLLRTELPELFQQYLDDEAFLEQIKSDS